VKLGFFGINTGILSHPDAIARVARAAEAAGYESLWTGEHVVLIDPREPPSPVEPRTRFLDQVAALTWAAAHTQRIRLATGIIILPQRNPVVLAKELASLDVLSGGRLIVGVGVGYVQGEFDALGVPFEERGPRTSEHIEVLRELWTSEAPRFAGRFTRFAGIRSEPRPVQRPHPPILVGGMSRSAFRRAVAHANGWYGFALDPDATRKALDALTRTASRVERPAALGPLEITITPPPGPLSRDGWKRYEDLGVSRVVLLSSWGDMQLQPGPGGPAEDTVIAFLEQGAHLPTLPAPPPAGS
jgi:probable F420-dependent oxidoreductase